MYKEGILELIAYLAISIYQKAGVCRYIFFFKKKIIISCFICFNEEIAGVVKALSLISQGAGMREKTELSFWLMLVCE